MPSRLLPLRLLPLLLRLLLLLPRLRLLLLPLRLLPLPLRLLLLPALERCTRRSFYTLGLFCFTSRTNAAAC